MAYRILYENLFNHISLILLSVSQLGREELLLASRISRKNQQRQPQKITTTTAGMRQVRTSSCPPCRAGSRGPPALAAAASPPPTHDAGAGKTGMSLSKKD